MPKFTHGGTPIVLQQPDLSKFQGNGSVVLDSRRTRPLWFDGRFLAARDLEREQNYFLQRQADLGQAGGFGVLHGLWVDLGTSSGQPGNAETIVIHAGNGVTPAGELVMIPNDLTIRLSDLADEENLDVQFGLSKAPQQPARTRTGIYVIALRPVEFTANPISAYPTSIQGTRSTHDGDIVEATAISLVPYPNPVNSFDTTLQQAALARQIFVSGNPSPLPDSLLPIAMAGIDRGVIKWLDPYLVRRDSGPQFNGVRFGLTDPAVQQAFLMQYDAHLQAQVAARSPQKANFAATDFFQALPPAGRFPLDAIDTGNFSQIFFPQQMDVRLTIIPSDELPALLEESMTLPPIDLTLPAEAYANLAVFALIPVPRASFAALKQSLPETPLNPTLPQVLANRLPAQLLRLYRGQVTFTPVPPVADNAWAKAINGQKLGFYLRRRSQPNFVDFTTPQPVTTTTSTTTIAPTTTAEPTTTPIATTTPEPTTTVVATTSTTSTTTAAPATTTTPRPTTTLPRPTTTLPRTTRPPTTRPGQLPS